MMNRSALPAAGSSSPSPFQGEGWGGVVVDSFPEGVCEDDRSARRDSCIPPLAGGSRAVSDSIADAPPINADIVFAAVPKEIAASPEDVCSEPVASGSVLHTAGSKPRRIDPFEGAARGPKVMFVATSGGQGGIERHSVHMADQIAQCGVDVSFLCASGSLVDRRCQALGIRTGFLNPRNSFDLRSIRQFADYICEFDAEIVHVHSRRDYVPAVIAVMLARRRRQNSRLPRLILHSHLDKPLGTPPKLARRLFASSCDGVIAVSEAVRRRLLSEHGFAPSFVRLLYNGIDLDSFAVAGSDEANNRRKAARKDLAVPADALVIGMVGRLNDKGQSEVLTTAAPLLRRNRHLWIVLVGPEGAAGDTDRLREQAMAEGISPHTLMTGSREDIAALLPAFDVLVHLPDSESFGLAIVESMASGLPVIATDVGGCAEVVVNEVTGLIVPLGDRGALQGALSRLIINDNAEDIRRSMGLAGRKVACARFAMEHQISYLMRWYHDMVSVKC